MHLINFSHPITDSQRAQVEELTGAPVHNVVDVKAQFDQSQPFAEQVMQMIEGVGFNHLQWQGERIVVNLPALAPAAALTIAQLHGRMGYLPTILRLRPVAGSTPPQFEVAEALNLQAERDIARQMR